MPARSSQVVTGFGVEPVDDVLHLDGEVHGAPNVVQPGHAHPAAGQIAVVQGPHLLDAEILSGSVELAGQLVHDRQQFVGAQVGGQFVEADDVGEDDGDVLVILRDSLLALR